MPALTESPIAAHQVKPDVDKPHSDSLDIIDIRGEHVEINLKEEVISMFNPENGPRMLPTLLLYNEKGLQLFEDVCVIAIPKSPILMCHPDHVSGRVLLDQL